MGYIDEHTILLLHMNDDTFKDECGHEIINNGVTLETTNKKFGNGGAYANNKVLTIDSNDIVFNTNDFTIDFWIYYISGYAGCSSAYIGTGAGIFLQPNIVSIGNSIGSTKISLSENFMKNKWTHCALVRHLNTFYYFVNGKLIASAVINTDITNSKFCINARYGSGQYTGVAYYDEFRISNVARWTSDFILPDEEYGNKYLLKKDNYYSIKEDYYDKLNDIYNPQEITLLNNEQFNQLGIDFLSEIHSNALLKLIENKYNLSMLR